MGNSATASFDLPSPRGHAPLRIPGSLRRTTSMDITWAGDRHGDIKIEGIGRDCYTPAEGGHPVVIHRDELTADIDPTRTIFQIQATPDYPSLQTLRAVHALKGLRALLNDVLAEERAQGLPLYQLASDITGCMVAGEWAWACRQQSLSPEARARRIAALAKMEGVCTGFSPGASSLHTDGAYQASMAALVPELAHPDDPDGWHPLPQYKTQVTFRRARRLDLWLDGNIEVESTFQDSAINDDGQRLAVHEYSVRARFDRNNWQLLYIAATPHILPFPECPGAVAKIQRLVGTTAQQLRETVSERLHKVDGCTHLNDAARALAEIPALAELLLSLQHQPVKPLTR